LWCAVVVLMLQHGLQKKCKIGGKKSLIELANHGFSGYPDQAISLILGVKAMRVS
jgi:hypothetical protein